LNSTIAAKLNADIKGFYEKHNLLKLGFDVSEPLQDRSQCDLVHVYVSTRLDVCLPFYEDEVRQQIERGELRKELQTKIVAAVASLYGLVGESLYKLEEKIERS